jgi:type IV secretory pathway TraG/TraD family ATPase VirD4
MNPAIIIILIIGIIVYFKVIKPKDKKEEEQEKNSQTVNTTGADYYYHLPKYDTQHTLVTGTTGSGKTQLLYRLLQDRMKQPGRFIIFDLDADYLKSFYKKGDVILDIMDARSFVWDFLEEIDDPAMLRQAAYLLIPPNPKESQPFFRNSARDMLEAKLIKLWQNGTRTNADIINNAVKIDNSSNKDAASTYKQALRPLLFFNTAGEKFKLREWLFNPQDSRKIFLTYALNYEDIERPFLNLFTSTLNNTILSKEFSNNKNKINIFIDELANIGKIENIDRTLSLSRHKNVAYFLATQSPKTLHGIYDDAFYGILENCNNNYHFRANERESAELISKSFGEKEVREMLSSTSSHSSDGLFGGTQGMTEHIRKVDIVMSSEVLGLEPLMYYARFLTDAGIRNVRRKLNYIPPEYQEDIRNFVKRTEWNIPEFTENQAGQNLKAVYESEEPEPAQAENSEEKNPDPEENLKTAFKQVLTQKMSKS